MTMTSLAEDLTVEPYNVEEDPYQKFGPKWEPSTPADRYRELLRGKGVGPVRAWRQVCSESEWWTDERIIVRDTTNRLFSNLMSLELSGLVSASKAGRSKPQGILTYRTADNKILDCVFNPWKAIRQIRGYTLAHADALADVLNLPLNSLDRMAEVALAALRNIMDGRTTDANDRARRYGKYEGDTIVPLQIVEKEFRWSLADVNPAANSFDIAIADLTRQLRVMVLDVTAPRPGMTPRATKYITETCYVTAEQAIAKRCMSDAVGTDFGVDDAPEGLDPRQATAFLKAFRSSITLVEAPPGYGKTRVVAEIVDAAKSRRIPVRVGAYMGRAATRVSKELRVKGFDLDKMKVPPNTLHSLLRINLDGDSGYGFDVEDNRPGIFIIDEASMVDSLLLGTVMRLVPANWNVVIMGDSRQLPPIKSGAPFADLVKSPKAHPVSLGKYYRAEKYPDIGTALDEIRARRVPESTDNFRIYRAQRANAIPRIMEIIRATAKDLGCNPLDLLVCCPQNGMSKSRASYLSGLVTTAVLNEEMKKAFNPSGCGTGYWGWKIPAVGDRVIADKPKGTEESANRAHAGRAMNGEMGTLLSADSDGKVMVQWDGAKLTEYTHDEAFSDERMLNLGYAVSVHKVQGAEAPAVIFVADGNNWWTMMTNAMTYTACSRGQKRTVVITIPSDKNESGFSKGVVTSGTNRVTLLPHLLTGDLTINQT